MSSLDSDSAVKLRAILELPNSPVKYLMVASIVGSWVPVYGGHVQLRSGERAVATRLSPKQRKDACDLCGITVKTFQNNVTDWVSQRLAHLCGKSVTTLFVTPLRGDAAICPSCREPLSPITGAHLPESREEVSRIAGRTTDGIPASTSGNGADSRKVNQQGEGEGGEARPTGRTALQEVLEEEEQALTRFRAAFPESKEEAS